MTRRLHGAVLAAGPALGLALGLALGSAPATAQAEPARPFRGFIENQGQWATEARFVAELGGLLVRAEPGAIVLQKREPARHRGAVVRLVFEGASAQPRALPPALPRAGTQAPGEFHYFLSEDPAAWRRHVRAWADVVYPDVAPGLAVRLYEREGRFEYDVESSPDADLSDFVVRCEGVSELSILASGELRMGTDLGPIVQAAPVAWELTGDGEPRPIRCAFRILDGQRFGLVAPGRQPGSSLVVDPGLTWSSYLGGSGLDETYAVRVTPDGKVLVLGRTISPDFPATAGVFTTVTASSDVCVTCIEPSGEDLVFSTHFGGTQIEVQTALAVAADGRIAVGGRTNSPDYPLLPDAYDTSLSGLQDGFVSVLSADGSQLLVSTLLGGAGGDDVAGVGFTSSGQLVAAGATGSPDFPATPDAFDATHSGSGDGFVAWLDPSLTGAAQLVACTFLGSTSSDSISDLAIGPGDEPIVAGPSQSADFPTTPGAYDVTPGAGDFITRLSADGSALVASTRFKNIGVRRIVVDGDTILLGGGAGLALPVQPSAFDKTWNGSDTCVVRMDGQLSQVLAATYLGGNGMDFLGGLAVDPSGRIVVSGSTASTDFPTTPGAYDTIKEGSTQNHCSMVTYFSADLSQLLYGSFLGPAPGGSSTDVAVVATADVVLCGSGAFSNFPVTPAAFDTTYGAGALGDGYVARMRLGPATFGYMSGALAGYSGLPQLTATGDLVAGHLVRFTLTSAVPSTPVTLVIGLGQAWQPFKSGSLVPSPDVLITGFATDLLGQVTISGPWPAGIPSGLTFYGQFWMKDAVAAKGFAASNGLSFTTP